MSWGGGGGGGGLKTLYKCRTFMYPIEAEVSSQRWESEAKEAVERAIRAEAKRDVARHEASMARLDAEAAGSTQA